MSLEKLNSVSTHVPGKSKSQVGRLDTRHKKNTGRQYALEVAQEERGVYHIHTCTTHMLHILHIYIIYINNKE